MIIVFMIIAAIGTVYFVWGAFSQSRLVLSDDSFEQYGVKVDFKKETITINNHTYNVNQVTGIRTITGGAVNRMEGVEIQVDDFKNPVHKIGVGSFGGAQQKFAQRLSLALRKAGGPDFS